MGEGRGQIECPEEHRARKCPASISCGPFLHSKRGGGGGGGGGTQPCPRFTQLVALEINYPTAQTFSRESGTVVIK